MRGPLLGKEQRIFMNGNAVGEMDSQLTKDQSLRTLFSEDPVGSAHFESSQRVLGSRRRISKLTRIYRFSACRLGDSSNLLMHPESQSGSQSRQEMRLASRPRA